MKEKVHSIIHVMAKEVGRSGVKSGYEWHPADKWYHGGEPISPKLFLFLCGSALLGAAAICKLMFGAVKPIKRP